MFTIQFGVFFFGPAWRGYSRNIFPVTSVLRTRHTGFVYEITTADQAVTEFAQRYSFSLFKKNVLLANQI